MFFLFMRVSGASSRLKLCLAASAEGSEQAQGPRGAAARSEAEEAAARSAPSGLEPAEGRGPPLASVPGVPGTGPRGGAVGSVDRRRVLIFVAPVEVVLAGVFGGRNDLAEVRGRLGVRPPLYCSLVFSRRGNCPPIFHQFFSSCMTLCVIRLRARGEVRSLRLCFGWGWAATSEVWAIS